MVYYLLPISAGVVELVDTGDLKSPGSDTVPVRVRSPAPSKYRGVEQLVARRAHNPEAVGSSPASATRKVLKSQDFRTFFALFLPDNLLTVFSDPNADPNGSG